MSVGYDAVRVGGTNWGDIVAAQLFEYITGRKPILLGDAEESNYHPHKKPVEREFQVLLMVSSILDRADRNCGVWTAGYISDQHCFKEEPYEILAVRGPLTKERLICQGLSCPDVYGDATFLLPRYYNPKEEKRYALGVVPHAVDQGHPWVKVMRERDDVLVIDIKGGVFPVVDRIRSCERIVSSSLHGLVIADAYEIPSRRIVLSNKIIGGDFKFHDYYTGLHVDPRTCTSCLSDVWSMNKLISAVGGPHANVYVVQERLMATCPLV